MKNLETLRAVLEKEKFPLPYTVKLIGKNTDAFNAGIAGFEAAHPSLTLQSRRASGGEKHLAFSYHGVMANAEQIIEIYRSAATLPDLMVLL